MVPDPEDRIESSGKMKFEPVKDPQAASNKNNWGLVMVCLVVLAIIGGGGWYIYDKQYQGFEQNSIKIIRADVSPIKIKPAEPGGMNVPDRDKLVYNSLNGQGAGSTVERLLPPPEEPLEKPQATLPDNELVEITEPDQTVAMESGESGESGLNSLTDQSELKEPVSLEPTAVNPSPNPPADEPQVATSPPPEVVVPEPLPKPELSASVPEVSPVEVARVAPEVTPEVVSETAPVAETQDNAPVAETQNITPVAVTQDNADTTTPTPTVTPTPTTTTSVAATSDNYRIQLAALRSEKRATGEWKRLQKNFPDLLSELTLIVVRVDLGAGKGVFYRLRAGPLASKQSAKATCDKLAKRNQGCLVIRPGK